MKLTSLTQPPQLRIDTSVGTRVFAGDVMIYGDTGLRQANDLAAGFDFSTAAHHGMTLQRVGNKVTLEGLGVRSTAEIWMTQTLPSGFRPRKGEFRSNRGFAQIGGTVYPIGNSSTLLRMATVSKTLDVGAVVNFKAEWDTSDNWPALLPGAPA